MCLFRFIYFSKIFYLLKDVGLSKLNMTNYELGKIYFAF